MKNKFIMMCWIETGVLEVPKHPHGSDSGIRKRRNVTTKNNAYQPPTMKGRNAPPITAADIADKNSSNPTVLTKVKDDGNPRELQASPANEGERIFIAPPIANSWHEIKNKPELIIVAYLCLRGELVNNLRYGG
ncbi:MAG: hypothetical protein VX353_02010 [Actinomycetota bacterium]